MRSAALLFSLALGVSGAILYEGATIISFNDTTERLSILHDASLLIEGETIAALSEGTLNRDIPNNTTRINATGSIISPGYVNEDNPLSWSRLELHAGLSAAGRAIRISMPDHEPV